MKPFHFQPMGVIISTILLLTSGLAKSGIPSLRKNASSGVSGELLEEEACPPCELLFRNLESTRKDGKLIQEVRVQERGEPKSGTGVMFDWASGTLIRTCDYLQQLFGEQSCWVDFKLRNDGDDGQLLDRFADRRMTFQPALGASDARCSCETIERVSFIVSRTNKHSLPVDEHCAYRHKHGIDLGSVQDEEDNDRSACTFSDGTKPNNNVDLWRCMSEADCDITDDWLQMVVLRDPRPAIVSTYFQLEVHNGMELGNLETFVEKELPILCQWLAIRYNLFSGLLPHQSVEFWYQEAMDDPLEWHYRWLDAIGLQLPSNVVKAMAQAASANDLDFDNKQIDLHPGEEGRADTGARKFEDEVSPEVLEIADAVLRVWLPPVLLEKLGVSP